MARPDAKKTYSWRILFGSSHLKGLRNGFMNAQELADKFTAKIAVAAVEKHRQTEIAADNVGKRTAR